MVPAISHIDKTARLQTVTREECPLYYALLSAFYQRTKVPMVLNTSFNRKSQPIVETPEQAIDTFLAAKGSLDALYMGQFEIRMKPFPRELLLSFGRKKKVEGTSLLNGVEEEDFESSDVPIFAVSIYLSEVTTAVSNVDTPVRIRVQDGGDEEWRTLPSLKHLEILQALQQESSSPNSQNEMVIDEDEFYEVTVADLFEVYCGDGHRQMDVDDEEGNGKEGIELMHQSITRGLDAEEDALLEEEARMEEWKEVVDVLEWLFQNCFVYFDEAQDPVEVFRGMDVVDLR